jgi:hypothetical protein
MDWINYMRARTHTRTRTHKEREEGGGGESNISVDDLKINELAIYKTKASRF